VNLVADESVEELIVRRLREDGHDVVYVAEVSPSATDEDLLRQANATGALLLTSDRDFGDLVFRQRRVHAGVILLRLAGMSNAAKANVVSAVCRQHEMELPEASLMATCLPHSLYTSAPRHLRLGPR
jgi:predicted nuclease of predicted toxin-antitoxin system